MNSATSTKASDTERQAILGVLSRIYTAWKANDAEAFTEDYLDDASVVQPGVYKKDRHEIQTTMAAAFDGPLHGSLVISDPQDIRFINDDTAILISEDGILFPGQDTIPSEAIVRATWVLVKRDENWYVAAYHNSPAQ